MSSAPVLTVQSVRSATALRENNLYMCDFKKLVPSVNLYPFLIMEYCPSCSSGQIFFFKEVEKTEIIYMSSQCGHKFNPSSYFSDITGDEVKSKVSQEVSHKKTDEQISVISAEQSETIYKIALEMALMDGPLSSKEKEKLNIYRDKFNIDETKARELQEKTEGLFREEGYAVEKAPFEGIISSRIDVQTSLIYKQYPYPIAYNYWQLNQPGEDYGLTLKYLCNLLSSILTYLSSVLVAQYIRDPVDDINLNILLERLAEPSLEEWVLFLEEILKVYHEENEKLILGDLYKYYFSKQSSGDALLKAYKEISEDDFFLFKGKSDMENISPAEFFRLIPDFVEAINSSGDDLTINQIKRLLAIMVPAVDEIMMSLKFLVAFKLFYVKKASYVKGKARHEVLDCMGGINFEESEYLSENYFAQDRVYIRSTVDKNFPVLNLSPFFILTEYPQGSGNNLFFYQKVTGDGNLEYLPYKGDNKFVSQEYARDLIKAFRKFTSEKKVNLVIKLLDWQKEKRKRDGEKRERVITKRPVVKQEERKLHEESKMSSELKKHVRNTYRYALEAAWCDGILTEDEESYLDELKNSLKIPDEEARVINKSTAAKFAVKIDRASTDTKKQQELEQHLEFLEEEHEMLLRSLEERRQQIRILGKSLKSLYEEKDICKNTAEQAEKEKIEKEKENISLKKDLEKLESKVKILEKDSERASELKKLDKKLEELEQAKNLGDKKLKKVGKDFVKAKDWYEKAAAQGDPDAQCILGDMYADGQGAPQDDVIAYKWFSLAGSCGIEDAMAALEELESIMTTAQIAAGKKLAEQWKPVSAP